MENTNLREFVNFNNISSREGEILDLIAESFTSRQIACKLNISIRTVEWHRANLLSKLKITHPPQLIIFAVEYSKSRYNGKRNNLR